MVMPRANLDEDELRRLYHEEGLTQEEIADRLDVGVGTVSNYMNEYGIETKVRGNLAFDITGSSEGHNA